MCSWEQFQTEVTSALVHLLSHFSSSSSPHKHNREIGSSGSDCVTCVRVFSQYKNNTYFYEFSRAAGSQHQLRQSNSTACCSNRLWIIKKTGKGACDSVCTLEDCPLGIPVPVWGYYPTTHPSTFSVLCPLGPWGPARLQQRQPFQHKLLPPAHTHTHTRTHTSLCLPLFHQHSPTIAYPPVPRETHEYGGGCPRSTWYTHTHTHSLSPFTHLFIYGYLDWRLQALPSSTLTPLLPDAPWMTACVNVVPN